MPSCSGCTLLDTVSLLATVSLGLSAGALLAEGALLVPMWRAMPPQEFLEWYRRNAALLLRFFGPLEVIPVVFAGLALLLSWSGGTPQALRWAATVVLAVGVLIGFPLYFKAANASFETASIELDQVASELRRWASWHWGRTLLATLAFALAALN